MDRQDVGQGLDALGWQGIKTVRIIEDGAELLSELALLLLTQAQPGQAGNVLDFLYGQGHANTSS